MRSSLLATTALLAVACHGHAPAGNARFSVTELESPAFLPDGKPDAKPDAKPSAKTDAKSLARPDGKPVAPPDKPAAVDVQAATRDFTPEGKALLAVGACGDVPAPDGVDPKVLASHCDVIRKAQADYLEQWVKPARNFFGERVPRDVPRRVVYPFAGGDLSTALTVFPDADEITTLSLEPAGDPRDLGQLKGRQLDAALKQVQYELKFLYRVNFSNTLNMIGAMRGGALPAQLIFGLSALKIHGYEVVALRYFRVQPDGVLHYLDDREVAAAPAPAKAAPHVRNRIFANVEIQFRRPGGRVQVYRHIQWNLDNDHLKKDPSVLRHLEAKGTVAGMTKAASYLLSWDAFSTVRDYLIKHVSWMVSDATGVAPKWGKPAGFEYETYGAFTGPHIPAGAAISKDWRGEFEAAPKRDLAFRFGYYDRRNANHLVIMTKKKI